MSWIARVRTRLPASVFRRALRARTHVLGGAFGAGIPLLQVILGMIVTSVTGCGSSSGTQARVTIPAGSSMRAAAESLHKAGVVSKPRLFRWYATARRADRDIQPGTYLFNTGTSWSAALTSLRGGGAVISVVVPEGFRLTQIAPLLATKLTLPADSVIAAARDTALLRRLEVPIADLEGYLFPDTYFFPPGTTARAAVGTMVRRFEHVWRPEWRGRLDSLSLSRHQIVTLASIVEGEAKRDNERPLIAAVYLNRLRKGMRLEADPTVQYALPEYQKRLLLRHLTVASPYNTYRRKGLPPGPISSPGAASLRASLHPASAPFLYFVAYPDGHHEFRLTLEEHQAAARLARRAWNTERARQAAAAAAARRAGTKTPGP